MRQDARLLSVIDSSLRLGTQKFRLPEPNMTGSTCPCIRRTLLRNVFFESSCFPREVSLIITRTASYDTSKNCLTHVKRFIPLFSHPFTWKMFWLCWQFERDKEAEKICRKTISPRNESVRIIFQDSKHFWPRAQSNGAKRLANTDRFYWSPYSSLWLVVTHNAPNYLCR